MSKNTGIFICPSCQNVIQHFGPLGDGVTCGECKYEFGKPDQVAAAKLAPRGKVSEGKLEKPSKTSIRRNVTSKKSPIIKMEAELTKAVVPVKAADEVAEEERKDSRDDEVIMFDGSRRVRRRKKRPKKEKNRNLVLFLVGWISAFAVILALYKMSGKSGEGEEEQVSEEAINEKTMKEEILRRFFPQVTQSFSGFMNHPTNKGREQFISNSADLALSFSRYYRVHPFPKIESQLRDVDTNVIKLSEEDFGIETIWQDEEGNRLGAVHLWDGGVWKLDWENFAPYSTEPWARFLSENGKSEGTFRLLVRKRETDDESEKFYLSFCRPPLLYEKEGEFRVTESPQVELATHSDLGQEFLRLWEEHKAGEVPFGSILGRSLDPPNYLRINVSLAWEKDEQGESVMVLRDILGVLWFGEEIQKHYRESQGEENESEINSPDIE